MAIPTKPNIANIWANTTGNITDPGPGQYASGWTSGQIPPSAFTNFVFNRTDNYLTHVNNAGIPAWDNLTEYNTGSYVTYAFGGDPADTRIYRSLTDANTGNVPDISIAQWEDMNSKFATIPEIGKVIWVAPDVEQYYYPAYLACNGSQTVSRTTFALLFAEIGTLYGVGDGSTTFGVPDLRGRFVRGTDDLANRDPGRVHGSTQLDEFKSHTHTWATSVIGGSTNWFASDGSAIRPTNTQTLATGGSETRPNNIALRPFIRTGLSPL